MSQDYDGTESGHESPYYSAVQRIMSEISPSILRQFHKLTTDDDRFVFVSKLAGVHSTLAAASPLVACSDAGRTSSKSGEQAGKWRQKGNELYKNERLEAALGSYTSAVLVAPVTDYAGDGHDTDNGCDDEDVEKTNLEFVLALGNRAACLLQMKRYDDSLVDITLALRYGYPRHLSYKLYDRQARALVELSRYDEALEALRSLLSSLPFSKLDPKQSSSISRNAEKKMDMCSSAVMTPSNAVESTPKSVSDGGDTAPPGVTGRQSDRFPGASDVFDVRFHHDKGRYGVAGRDVSIGEVLLVESPYVSVLAADAFSICCYNCFRLVNDIPLACHTCNLPRYCSEHCRKHSWDTYHAVECRYLGLLIESGTGAMAHLTIKLLTMTGLGRVLKCRQNPKSSSDALRQSVFTNSAGVYLGGYVALYGLLSHSESRSPADLLQYTLLAVWLTDILYRTAFAKQSASNPDTLADEKELSMVGGVVLRFLQIVACNGVDITELQLGDTLHRSHPVSVGLALYPTVSLLNHSCDPVLELVFYGDKCAVRAVQNVRTGSELYIDYGHVYYTESRAARRTALHRQYYFDCQCVACSLEWSLKAQLPSGAAALKCVDCGSPLDAADLDGDPVECRRCRRQQESLTDRLDVLASSQTAAEKAINDARKFHVTKSTTSPLEEHLTVIDKYIQLPWKDYVVCLSTLKQCYRCLGNHRRTQ